MLKCILDSELCGPVRRYWADLDDVTITLTADLTGPDRILHHMMKHCVDYIFLVPDFMSIVNLWAC